MDTNTDGPAWLRRRHGMKAGSAGVPPAQHWHSLTPLSHPARPATAPRFRFSRAQTVPAGRVAGSRIAGKLSGHPTQRMRARRPRSRRGASSHPSCSARRHCPCRCGRAAPLRVPLSSFVCRRGSLFFLLFQTSGAPALPGRSYESETRDVHGLSGTRFLNMDAQDNQDGRVQHQS